MTGKKVVWLVLVVVILLFQPSRAWIMYSADAPDTGLVSNSFVDILYHEGILWLAGGQGLSYSTDQGLSWYTRTSETNPGLSSDELSALFGRPGQIWVADAHFESFEGINYPFGNGISLSLDAGETWETFTPPEASSFGQLVYDISGTETATYAACFHGGMIVRHDPDTAWEHVFYSAADSLDWDADDWVNLPSGRYYSCAVDTTHADTLIVYGGSGRGINKFLYLPKRVKLGGRSINDIAHAGDLIYLAHEGGVTQADTATLEKIYTADATNGLGDGWVRKMELYGGRLWASVLDPADSSSQGLYYLDNPETEWTEIGQSLSGPPDLWGRAVTNFFDGEGGAFDINGYQDSIQSALYIAAGDSGVFRSIDSGQTWNRFFVDPLDTLPTSPRNQVFSIDISADSLFLGTRAGLIIASYSLPFTIDYDTLITFVEDDSTGSMVSLVRHQDDDSASFTYVGLSPQTDSGNYATLFLDPDSTGKLRQTHLLYDPLVPIELFDLYVTENTTVMATTAGLYFSLNFPSAALVGKYDVIDLNSGRTLQSFAFLSAEVIGERLFTGSSGGFGYKVEINDWRVFTANTDPQKHDLAVAVTHANFGLPGDWVIALDVHKYDTGAVLWAACRRVADTLPQINAVGFSTDYGDTWQEVLPNEQVWNFAFDDNDIAYAAASAGLFAAGYPWTHWERIPIIDPVTQDTIVTETEVFSVEVAEDVLWVGTEFGLAHRNLAPGSDWSITRIFTPTSSDDEVFAAPVPYSPINNNGRLSIHYHVDESADISVEVYDFAMNLVAVLADGRHRNGGSDYYETWDGYNGRGDMVATGIYYVKVSYSTGKTRWGRLAIIP
jgi:hypothetical protein